MLAMDISDLISRLTLDEKITLLIGKDSWSTEPVPRLGIPSIRVSDGPHGLRYESRPVEGGPSYITEATCFPTSSALAATWDMDLIREIGAAMAEEAAGLGVDVILGPGTNIKRTPVCGRNFEYFSEDPFLAGECAAAYIAGVQDRGVGTSLKHFAANNQELGRTSVSVEVDERTLREIYLRPFEIAVRKSQPWTVMCSYNRLAGIYASENAFLLDRVLRHDFGFQGLVLSDWGAVHDRAKALTASLELEMPHGSGSFENLKAALANGEITEAEIDRAVASLLRLVEKAVEGRRRRPKASDRTAHRALARAAALQAVTLLKNDGSLLPLNPASVTSLAVIGRFAKDPMIQGGGSAFVTTKSIEGALETMQEHAVKAKIRLDYEPAYSSWAEAPGLEATHEAQLVAEKADCAVVFVGTGHRVESESFDRAGIRLNPDLERLILMTAAMNPRTVVVVQAGSAIDMSAWIDKVKAVVFAWFGGEAGGPAVADVLFGAANPCGKLAETFPLRLEDTPSFDTYPGDGNHTWYRESLFVGYRHYDSMGTGVLFPFGHGLSYTSFLYADLRVTPDAVGAPGSVTVACSVTNTGDRRGSEIVQVYVGESTPRVVRPTKELKGFVKIELDPGEKGEVRFALTPRDFAYWNASLAAWHVQSGTHRIFVGSSSRDIRLEAKIAVAQGPDFS